MLWLCDLWPVLRSSGLSFPVYKKETSAMDAVKLSTEMKDIPWEASNILTRMGEGKETLLCGPDSVYLNFAFLS